MFSNKMTAPVLTMAAMLAGCGGAKESRPAATEAAPVAVQTVAVKTVEWPDGYEATGTVRARTTGVVSSRLMGYVRELRVGLGDTVKAGQVLVVLDARDIEAGYRQAEAARGEATAAVAEADNGVAAAKAQAELAQSTFKRMQDLFEKKSISNQEFDEASARVKLAEAALQMAVSKRRQLDAKIRQADEGVASAGVMKGFAELRAPFTGTVVEKHVESGNLVTPGAPLLTVEQAGAYRLEAQVEESMLGRVRVGLGVTVALDGLGKSADGRVTEIVPSIDASSRTFTAKIDLPSFSGLRSGMYGRAVFAGDVKTVAAVPEQAVREQGQVRLVLVSEKGYARGRMVTLGRRRAGQVEVLSGLSEGEQVVSPLAASLVDGARLEVRP